MKGRDDKGVGATERQIESLLATVAPWRGRCIEYERAVQPAASPMQRGVDGNCWLVEVDGTERFFVKQAAEEARRFLDPAATVAAAAIAAAAEIAPRLVWADPSTGDAVWEFLDSDWSTATLGALASPALLAALISAKRTIHRGPAFPRTRSVFELVERYAEIAFAAGIKLPEDYAWMLENVREIGRAIAAAGVDVVPCHGDGIASNVMVGPRYRVLLVDWDEAVNADPYWDLGSLFAEAFAFDPPARAALELYDGCCDEAVFARCRLYGIADDLAWATRNMISAAETRRPDIEFFKYAQWRFLRCRMDLHDRRFEERLRAL